MITPMYPPAYEPAYQPSYVPTYPKTPNDERPKRERAPKSPVPPDWRHHGDE